MKNSVISGYTGIFTKIVDETFSSLGATIYALGDGEKNELELILLTPDCYTDVVRIITSSGITKVRLIVPSVSSAYITLLTNLIGRLGEGMADLKWVFPTAYVNSALPDVVARQLVLKFHENSYDKNIKIKFIASGSTGVYDILTEDGYKTRYFCQYLTEAEMVSTFADISFDEIHVPYNSGISGSLTYLTASALDNNYIEKLFPNTFPTVQDYYAATFDGLKPIPYSTATGEVETFIPTEEKYLKISNIVRNQAMLSYVAGCSPVSAISNTYAIDMANQANRTIFITNNYDVAQVETAVLAAPAQLETATVVGTVTTSGDASVTITAAGMTDSPKTISVAVLENDNASAVAGKIRAALTSDEDVSELFTVGGETDKVTLLAKTVTTNDGTLNIAIDNDTCAGLTAAATSTNSVASSVTTTGNATVTITADGMTHSPKAISVAVLLNDSPAIVAGKIRAVLAADEDVTELFTVGGSGLNITLTKTIPDANDTTLNIAIANGTCTGLTEDATSDNTVAGGVANKAITVAHVPVFAKLTINLKSITATTMAWFDNISWISAEPTFLATKFYEIQLLTVDGGATWYGRQVAEW